MLCISWCVNLTYVKEGEGRDKNVMCDVVPVFIICLPVTLSHSLYFILLYGLWYEALIWKNCALNLNGLTFTSTLGLCEVL